jgi:hypothetical protein
MGTDSRNDDPADLESHASIKDEVVNQHQHRIMDLEEATRYTDKSTQAIVSGFRNLLLLRSDKHARSLGKAYGDAYARLQEKLKESADAVDAKFKLFVEETLVKLDDSRKKWNTIQTTW